MCRKLTYLVSVILVMGVAGNASAELVAYWTFDEGSGDTVHDSSGNGNDGTIYGAEWNTGKYGNALLFNGQDNYVEVPTSESLEITPNVTIAAWINWIDAGDTWLGIMANGQQNGPWENYGLFVNRDGRYLYFTLSLDGGHVTQSAPDNVIEPDEWLHACATWDGSTARIYVNGEMVLEQAQTGELVPPGLPLRIGHRNGSAHYYNGTIDEVRIYNHALTEVEILAAMQGGKAYPYALGPSPEDGAIHPDTWVNLSWSPGDFAVSHHVYFGENFDDVNNGAEGTFQANQVSTFFVVGFPGFPYPEGLTPGTTYYWRIDEVNETEPNSPWKGNVWSFMVPPKTAYNPDPVDIAESIDPNVVLSWTAGFGAKLHTVYFGENFDDVNNAAGGTPQGTTTYTPGPLELAKTYYWRVDEFDAVDTYKGDVWSFTIRGAVESLEPSDGAVDVKQTAIISWVPGVFAASHEVYFGTDEQAVKNADTDSPEYKGIRALGDESYDPGKLEWDTTYYWRIDEVNNLNPDSPWKGNVWSFTTANFLTVDDFEDYDAGDNQIWYAWKDGLGYGTAGTEPYYPGNGTGSAVGDENTSSYTEETIVHGGSQAMPLFYDNNKQGFFKYSEAELTLTYPRDWTENGVNRLTIWFRGDSANAAETLYVALNGSAVVTHDNPEAAQVTRWTEWNIDLQAFADQGVNLTNVDTIAIGLGNKKNPLAGGSGTMYFDDIRLYAPESEAK